jgi:hypothetical protein
MRQRATEIFVSILSSLPGTSRVHLSGLNSSDHPGSPARLSAALRDTAPCVTGVTRRDQGSGRALSARVKQARVACSAVPNAVSHCLDRGSDLVYII